MSSSAATLPDIEEFDRIWSRLAAGRNQMTEPIAESLYPFPNYVRFGRGGNACKYQLFGWNHAEDAFTWTEGAEAYLELPVSEPAEFSHFLNVRVSPLLASNLPRQRIRVYVGDTPIAHWDVRWHGHYFGLILGHLLTRTTSLRFQLPDSASPRNLGLNSDERELGLQFYELWLTPWANVSF